MTAYLGKWWHMYEFLACQENKCLTLGLLSVNEIFGHNDEEDVENSQRSQENFLMNVEFMVSTFYRKGN